MTKTKTYIEVSEEWFSLDKYRFVIDHCGQRGIITAEYDCYHEDGRPAKTRAKADYFVCGFRPLNGAELGNMTKIMVQPNEVVTLKPEVA